MMENFYIREIREDGYSMMMENFYIREIQEEGYSMMESVRENLRYKKENEEVKKMMYNIYENNKLMKKVRSKNNIKLDEIEKIINDFSNFEIEKDENVAKMNLEYLISTKIGIEYIEIITNELCKNEFNFDNKFRNKEELAKFIIKIYLEKKWLKIIYYSFLVTDKFISFQRIKKVVTNRNGIVLCFNDLNEIVCIYFLFIYGDVTYEIIDLFNETAINIEKEELEKRFNKLEENKTHRGEKKEKCSICQKNMKIYIKLKCCHNFHKLCLKEWFKIKQNCPLCRANFIDEITKLIEVKKRYNLIEYKYFEKKL